MACSKAALTATSIPLKPFAVLASVHEHTTLICIRVAKPAVLTVCCYMQHKGRDGTWSELPVALPGGPGLEGGPAPAASCWAQPLQGGHPSLPGGLSLHPCWGCAWGPNLHVCISDCITASQHDCMRNAGLSVYAFTSVLRLHNKCWTKQRLDCSAD